MIVNIGTPVHVVDGNDVVINIWCNVRSGMYPVIINWLRNGRSYGRENDSLIILDDASDGDVFSCIAKNCRGFDIKNTTITVGG